MAELRIISHPIAQDCLGLLRDKNTQTQVFRETVRRLSRVLAVYACENLAIEPLRVETPLMTCDCASLARPSLALVSILRAGNGMVDGFLDLCPHAAVGFVGLERDEKTFKAREYYCKLPAQLAQRDCLVLDPMLATGGSACDAIALLKAQGAQKITFISLLAAPGGVQRLQAEHPDVTILTAALDQGLNELCYILPGLGDAGDRIFGTN